MAVPIKKLVRRLLYSSAISIAVLLVATCVTAQIVQSRVLVVGTSTVFPPFEYFDGQDGEQIVGIDIDIATHIAHRARRTLHIENIIFDTLFDALHNGTVDFVVAGVPITDDVAPTIVFSDPYYDATQVAVIRTDDAHIQEAEDMRDNRIAVRAGGRGEHIAQAFTSPNRLLLLNNEVEALDALSTSQADVAILDMQVAQHYLAQRDDDLVMVDMNFEVIRYAVAVRQDDAVLRTTINEALAAMRAIGAYQESLERHTGGE